MLGHISSLWLSEKPVCTSKFTVVDFEYCGGDSIVQNKHFVYHGVSEKTTRCVPYGLFRTALSVFACSDGLGQVMWLCLLINLR